MADLSKVYLGKEDMCPCMDRLFAALIAGIRHGPRQGAIFAGGTPRLALVGWVEYNRRRLNGRSK